MHAAACIVDVHLTSMHIACYLYPCVCIHACVKVYIHACIRAYAHTCKHIPYVCMHVYMCGFEYPWIHNYILMCIHTYMQTNMRTSKKNLHFYAPSPRINRSWGRFIYVCINWCSTYASTGTLKELEHMYVCQTCAYVLSAGWGDGHACTPHSMYWILGRRTS